MRHLCGHVGYTVHYFPNTPAFRSVPVDPVKDADMFFLCFNKCCGYCMSSQVYSDREHLRQYPTIDAQSIEEEHQRLISKISSVVNTMVLPDILSLPGTSPAASA